MRKWKAEEYFLAGLILFCVGFVGLLFITQWPAWWKWIIFERTPMTWLESMLLFITAMMGYFCALTSAWGKQVKESRWWALLATGFLMLALDERFALHERIRDGILGPRNIRLPWTGAGDVILLAVMLIGLLLLPQFLKLFREHKKERKIFLIGAIVAGLAIVMDSFDVHSLSIPAQRWLQFVEEILETTAQLFFFTGLFLVWVSKVRKGLG